MKQFSIIITVILIMLLAACSPAGEEPAITGPAASEDGQEPSSVPALVTVTPTPSLIERPTEENTPMPPETGTEPSEIRGTPVPDTELVTPVSVDLSKITPAPTVIGTPVEMPLPGGIDPLVDMTAAMSRDLAKRLNVDVSEITVMEIEEVTWPDGSLGCPQPGFGYIQMLIPGFRVILTVDGEHFAYHAADSQNFVLCSADGAPVPSPAP